MRHASHLALAALLLASPALAAPSLEYLDSGQWTFNQDVAVQGTRAAVSLSYGMQLWELSDPAAPVMLGDYYLDGYRGWAIAWEGDLVALTSAIGHLYLIDVSDPAHPARIDRLQGLGNSADLALVRDGDTRWCYSAGSAANDFQIRDLTDPAASVLRGGLNLAGTPNGLAVLGDFVLISASAVGLYAVNVSNPDAPQLTDTEALPGTHVGVAADGTRAAVASGENGFTLFDVSNPANPIKHATLIPAAGAWSGLRVREVVLHDTTLWAICLDVGAIAYDISDLDNPVLIGYDPRLDITPPQAPPYYFFNEGVYADGRLYLSSWSGFTAGCIVLDAESSGMDYIGRSLGFDYVRDVDEEGGFVYGCTGQMGIFAHEHVSANQFVPRGHFHVVESWGVKAYGSTVYVASTTEGLVVGDFSDPDNPVRHDDLDVGQGRQVLVEDDIAYVVAFSNGLHTVDVSDWDHLVELDAVTRPGAEMVNIDKVGNLVVTADRLDGMNLWNVADPASIQHIANWPTGGQALDVALSPDGAYAYLAVAGQGVQVLDVSPPTNPLLLTTLSVGGVTGLQLADGYLHVSRGDGGVRSFHQAGAPTAPTELANFDTTHNAWNVCAGMQDGRHIVYVADYGGIAALRLNLDTPVAVSSFALTWTGSAVQVDWLLGEPVAAEDLRLTAAPATGGAAAEIPFAPLGVGGQAWQALDTRDALADGGEWRYTLEGREPSGDWTLLRSETIALDGAPAAAIALRAFPNPFNPSTQLDFALPTAGPARLAIYDIAGRELALLHEGPLPAGPTSFAWDGRDGQGRALPSGVYLARLALPGVQRQAKLVMLR